MKSKGILASVLVLWILLALAGGLSLAQGPEPPDELAAPEAEAAVSGVVPVQGRLTDGSGNPLDGSYTITATLYTYAGTPLCQDDDTVTVDNGLFNMYMDYCTASDIDGKKLYLGIQVGSDLEMTPRKAIYPVPYAWSLKPGAVISTTSWPALHVESTNPSGRALRAYASATSGTNYGVVGASKSPDGYGGYFYNTDSGVGVYGQSDTSGYGVYGQGGSWGVYGVGTSQGVMGECGSSYGFGGYFHHTDGGLALVADSTAANNDDIVRFRNNYNTRFKVQGDGDVYIDGSYYDTGADFAEMLPAQDGLEPGDVLIIAADGQLTRSTAAYQTAVVGVYSTKPGFVGGAGDESNLTGKVPLAIMGIVPVKASAENGAIRPGDLLVTSSRPGYAMRAGEDPPQGAVLGKALGELEEGAGVIEILVTLQ